ncbi:hypothetical protein SNOG_15435 [Parastagonospora nodorum SN15]|uniref:Uncharacterized protein n=1 Tax=Phaeosphaeria nodorum (strain SN15 / ATCC MYA-4574 / FGSC 10173) TaxID=321614 RepID=Q0TYA0_PHANO|nr:hypothetical protein SNOG_15435 [Parastagonospora nodorum SN15]EAT77100.1 hypothetical protein SNOG_15435 [Parastagonospora nodorum SN15]
MAGCNLPKRVSSNVLDICPGPRRCEIFLGSFIFSGIPSLCTPCQMEYEVFFPKAPNISVFENALHGPRHATESDELIFSEG